MTPLSTTRLSSKGQVVIPEEVRRRLGLEAGALFAVFGEGDSVLLKRIEALDRKRFRALAAEVRRQARRAGMKRADVKAAEEAVRKVRRSA